MSAAAAANTDTNTRNKSRTIHTIPDGVSLRAKTLARQQTKLAPELVGWYAACSPLTGNRDRSRPYVYPDLSLVLRSVHRIWQAVCSSSYL